MPHASSIDDVGHLHAGTKLVGLHPRREDADLAELHVRGNPRRQVFEGAGRLVFQYEERVFSTNVRDFFDQGVCDVPRFPIGNDRHSLMRLDAQADLDGILSARLKFTRHTSPAVEDITGAGRVMRVPAQTESSA